MNNIENKEEYKKGILKASAYEIPLIILLIIGFIQYNNDSLGLMFIGIMFIAGLIKLVATVIFCKDQLGSQMAIGMGVSGFMYTLVFIVLYYMV